MKIEEIKNRVKLEAWLKSRHQSDAMAIAHRAALRVMPLWMSAMDRIWAREADLTAVPILRLNLTSGVSRKYQTPEVKSAAAAAVAAAYDAAAAAAYTAAEAVDHSAYAYAIDAAYAAAAAADPAYAAAATFADAAYAAAATAFWKQIRWDAQLIAIGQDLLDAPPWTEQTPDWFTEHDKQSRVLWSANPAPWSFWLRWWDGVISGQPLDWKLQEAVALIPDEVWKLGPEKVAEAIADIELSFAIARTPNAEIIRLNPETGLIRLDPVSHLSGKHLADVVDTLTDATTIFDAHGGANGPYHALGEECQIVKDGCDRYANRPVMLLRICRRVVERVTLKEANGDCPKADPLVRDFISSVAGAAGDLMAFDADVKEAETARAAITLTPPSPETARALVIAADASAEISEGDLKAELPVSARQAISDQPSSERQLALYETKSRLLRIMAVTKDTGRAVSDHVEGHPVVYGSILTVVLFLLA